MEQKKTHNSVNLFLIGFMGTGKSTVARALKKMTGWEIVEMDEELVRRENRTIPEIFAEEGEEYFRQKETQLLQEMREQPGKIVSCGGGVAMREENVRIMKESGKTVLLTAAPETILERVRDDENRPLLAGRKTVEGISQLMEARREKYEAAADFSVSTDGKTAAEIVREIMKKLHS